MRLTTILSLICVFLLTSSMAAPPQLDQIREPGELLIGGNATLNKASRDSVLLIGPWGSAAPVNGQFQDFYGHPDWNGWTHRDVTQPTESHWQISDYRADDLGPEPEPGNLAAWCGVMSFPPCSPDDPEGGYGNNWRDQIEWFGTVPDPTQPVQVTFSAFVNLDTEIGYDWVYVQYLGSQGPVTLLPACGLFFNYPVTLPFSVAPDDFQGPDADQVHLRILFESDAAWSDEDCLFASGGAIQIDDITVTMVQGESETTIVTDFSEGWGDWQVSFPEGVGDFAQIWTELQDRDPCSTNYSPQVAFIDDGQVVPGVGPSYCQDWCYGPNGYVVNTIGGRLGPDNHLYNVVESPIIEWPNSSWDGLSVQVDAYLDDQPIGDPEFTGVLANFGIRSIVDNGVDPIEEQMKNASWTIGPDWLGTPIFYVRGGPPLAQHLEPGRTHIQYQMVCAEPLWFWGFDGNNATPAPYFDNVRMVAYAQYGPYLSAYPNDLPTDRFPWIGEVDRINLENNWVPVEPGVGDIECQAEAVRDGAELTGPPRLHFLIDQNPLFDPHRTNPEFGGATSGYVEADTLYNEGGLPVPGRWQFALPLQGFVFPGDVLHFYIEATDSGPGLPEQTVFLPADTTGFSVFTNSTGYPERYTVRALPTLQEDPLNPGELVTPDLLVSWNTGVHSIPGFILSLGQLGMVMGRDFDWMAQGSFDPDDQVTLEEYQDIIASSGATGTRDALDTWLRTGDRDLLLAHEDLVAGLMTEDDGLGIAFIEDWLKVDFINDDLRPLIENQAAPLVKPIPGNGVYTDDLSWVAYGSCPDIIDFDAVRSQVDNGAIRLAEFTSPAGGTGHYDYAAASLYQDALTGSRVLMLPYKLEAIHTAHGGEKVGAPLSARTVLLGQTLQFFGLEGDPLDVSDVPEAGKLSLNLYPNPFNPRVKVNYTLKQPGHLSLKVYNLRGELVRTLVNEHRQANGSVVWDGRDEQGGGAASGVYFCEARTANSVVVEKAVLVK